MPPDSPELGALLDSEETVEVIVSGYGPPTPHWVGHTRVWYQVALTTRRTVILRWEQGAWGGAWRAEQHWSASKEEVQLTQLGPDSSAPLRFAGPDWEAVVQPTDANTQLLEQLTVSWGGSAEVFPTTPSELRSLGPRTPAPDRAGLWFYTGLFLTLGSIVSLLLLHLGR
ncbi:MAG: hypothetical protein QGG40_03580 [Myxococcota bacterium]|jgi:hypothetical protein|nr:hypothetical protein [Myxococcota bacterium]